MQRTEALVDGHAYYLVAAVGPLGIALFGDRGRFVSNGKKRIPQLSDDGSLSVSVAFAWGESSITLHGGAASPPTPPARR